MVVFRAIKIEEIKRAPQWAVERTEPDGLQIIVSRFYGTSGEAEQEAEKLNHQAAIGTIG
jgi:hypothetical protein